LSKDIAPPLALYITSRVVQTTIILSHFVILYPGSSHPIPLTEHMAVVGDKKWRSLAVHALDLAESGGYDVSNLATSLMQVGRYQWRVR
jgi:hypothetical protein